MEKGTQLQAGFAAAAARTGSSLLAGMQHVKMMVKVEPGSLQVSVLFVHCLQNEGSHEHAEEAAAYC